MALSDHCIFTGRDGELDGTTLDEMRALVAMLAAEDRIVIHLHGGLVADKAAKAKAKELIPEYLAAGAYPVFFIYRTGLVDIVRNNLHEAYQEKIFKKLLATLMKFVVGKLTTVGGAKATGTLQTPRDLAVAIELTKAQSGEEPYQDLEPVSDLKDLTDEEEKLLTGALAADVEFQEEIQAIVNGATSDQETEVVAKGVTTLHRLSSKTIMSPEVVNELVDDAREKDSKGILLTAKLLVRVGRIFVRVVSRFVKKRDHGPYTTVVEELLRELYLANAGGAVWGIMKQETADTFQAGSKDSIRGGSTFVRQFGEMLKQTNRNPEVTVVAHSLGSVFACNLIEHLARAREDASHPLPSTFALENLILLAPAVEYELFAKTVSKRAGLFRHVRMFALNDDLEAGYWEVPFVYPRSLLYLVSGVFEEENGGRSAFDRPLLGMQRYFTRTDVYKDKDVTSVRKFFGQVPHGLVWAVGDQGPGRASDAIRHGGFDDAKGTNGAAVPRKTIDSILHILREGMP